MKNPEVPTASSQESTTEPIEFDCIPASQIPKGYPAYKLVAHTTLPPEGGLDLPDGPWCAGSAAPPSEQEQQVLARQGYQLDTYGRPLHPQLRSMLLRENGGVFTNKGMFRKWGPNRTGDPVIITDEPQPKIALVKRKDNQKWALPGGFVDPADGTDPLQAGIMAATREASEEVGLDLYNINPKVVCSMVVDDFRATAHSWPETTAILLRPPTAEVLTPDYKEVAGAAWFSLSDIPNNLHGSHGYLISEALKLL